MGGMGARGEAMDPAAFTRPFVYVSNVGDDVFRCDHVARPAGDAARDSPRGSPACAPTSSARRPARRRTGVTAALKGYDTATRYGEQYKNNVGRNVIAKIEGTDPTLKAQYVIAGGHLDHNGMTNGVIFNGADDNASGSAVTMEIARLLAASKASSRSARSSSRCGPARSRASSDRSTTRTTRPTA